jgi:hypothetical protein
MNIFQMLLIMKRLGSATNLHLSDVAERRKADTHGYLMTSNDVGNGGNMHYETTTSHSKTLRKSDLPYYVQHHVSTDEAKMESNVDLCDS